MLTGAASTSPPLTQPQSIALAGLLSLAVAMGIGRFAFTPVLPMMMADGGVTLPQASWLATSNYLGYWIGAMLCALQPALWARSFPGRTVSPTAAVRVGLVATALLTAAMALPLPAAWPALRFMAGLASALVFVYLSGWCLARLTALGQAAWAGLIFVGPGLGIAISGLAATFMVAAGARAAAAWLVFGLFAAVLTALVWPRLKGGAAGSSASSVAVVAPAPLSAVVLHTLAYGLAGYGYIVTATFLPVIARQALPGGSVWLDLFWPLFGMACAAGAFLTLRLPNWDRRGLLVVSYVMQAVGVALTVLWPSTLGFALGSLLLGLPFTAITLFAMQEARRLRPMQTSAFIGTLTAAWGLGQIAGPAMVPWLLAGAGGKGPGFERALLVATVALVLGALIYLYLIVQQPLSRPADSERRS